MADYIYLLETRISAAQRAGLRTVREIAKAKALTVFLVGGAVRDLTSGSPVRDLDVAVQGPALKLQKELEKAGAVITGEHDLGQALFARFPGGVRMEVGSTLSVTYPKPGKPVFKPATILDDLRRRDFTANAMALSLNEGSYGLLMDPLNGVADIEVRQLRLASNYGFIEDPVRMIRAARLMARLGWTLEERTQTRYETGKQENYIAAMSDFQRGYEAEEIVHEEDPLRVLEALEAEGWMKSLAPQWVSSRVNTAELERLRDTQAQLAMQGIATDTSVAQFPLLTAKMPPADVTALKRSFPRQGFVAEIESLEAASKQFATLLGGKGAASASDAWRIITSANPEAVLWTAFSTKSPALQARFKSFYTEWPQARQRIPYALMQEMRITPELPEYEALLERLFFELMDGRLTTPEEMKAFLEPSSPPAPPPPVNLRRPRAPKKEAKGKGRGKKASAAEEAPDGAGEGEEGDEDEDAVPSLEVEENETPKEPLPEPADLSRVAPLAAIAPEDALRAESAKARSLKAEPDVSPQKPERTPARGSNTATTSPRKTVAKAAEKADGAKAAPPAVPGKDMVETSRAIRAEPQSKSPASGKASPVVAVSPEKGKSVAGKPSPSKAGGKGATGKAAPQTPMANKTPPAAAKAAGAAPAKVANKAPAKSAKTSAKASAAPVKGSHRR